MSVLSFSEKYSICGGYGIIQGGKIYGGGKHSTDRWWWRKVLKCYVWNPISNINEIHNELT